MNYLKVSKAEMLTNIVAQPGFIEIAFSSNDQEGEVFGDLIGENGDGQDVIWFKVTTKDTCIMLRGREIMKFIKREHSLMIMGNDNGFIIKFFGDERD